jgi:outer membrane autotransporter protein
MYAAMMETQRHKAGLVPFAVLGGGDVRYDTGSHVDVDGVHFLMGLAWRAPIAGKSSLVAGAFLEAGWGEYDSRNSFTNAPNVKGKGDTEYYGAGFLGRYELPVGPGGVYGEASLHAGQAKTDFRSDDIVSGSGRASYDSDAMYYGAHLGGGYVWNITKKASLDVSTKYIWLRLDDDTVTVPGGRIKFKAADSHRWQTGGKFSYAVNDYVTPYAGAYFDYEFDGEAKATANGTRIDEPDLKGATGIGEVGLILRPAPRLPLSLDLGVQGYVGQREGVTGSLRVKYEF